MSDVLNHYCFVVGVSSNHVTRSIISDANSLLALFHQCSYYYIPLVSEQVNKNQKVDTDK